MSAPHYGSIAHERGLHCPQCGVRDLNCVSMPNPKPEPRPGYPRYTGWSRTVDVYMCNACGFGREDYADAHRALDRLERER